MHNIFSSFFSLNILIFPRTREKMLPHAFFRKSVVRKVGDLKHLASNLTTSNLTNDQTNYARTWLFQYCYASLSTSMLSSKNLLVLLAQKNVSPLCKCAASYKSCYSNYCDFLSVLPTFCSLVCCRKADSWRDVTS